MTNGLQDILDQYSPNPPPSGIQLDGNAPPMMPMQLSQLQPQQMQQPQQVDPRLSYINDVLGQYGQTKQKQQDTGGLIAQILSQRVPTTSNDTSRSLLNSSLNNTYESPEEMALAPYTKMAELQTKLSALKNRGGATGELIDRLMQENPGMNFQQALQRVQTGYRSGTQLDANGNIMAMPGMADAKGEIKYGEKSGEQQAVQDFAAPIEKNKQLGEAAGKTEANLPTVLSSGQQMLNEITQLRNHRGLPYAIGAGGALLPEIPGTAQADALARIKQVQGREFLQAYDTLRGAGAISEVEGTKAQDAIGRLSKAQSVDDFRTALDDLSAVVSNGMRIAQQRAGNVQGGAAPVAVPVSNGGATHRWNPQTNALEEIQ